MDPQLRASSQPTQQRAGHSSTRSGTIDAASRGLLPLPISHRRPIHSARDARRGDDSGDTRKADRSGCTVTAPPGPISRATAATWDPKLQAAAAAYGLIPSIDPSSLTRQVPSRRRSILPLLGAAKAVEASNRGGQPANMRPALARCLASGLASSGH